MNSTFKYSFLKTMQVLLISSDSKKEVDNVTGISYLYETGVHDDV